VKSRVADGEPVDQTELRRRATFRQLRLHACGAMRLSAPAGIAREWLDLLAVAERLADGDAGAAELQAARAHAAANEPPKDWRVDIKYALGTDEVIAYSKRLSAQPQPHSRGYLPSDSYYRLVLARYRLFEELLGPDPRPRFDPAWHTDTAVALARVMYEARDFSAMPILADALQDAGCDNPDILDHCRDTAGGGSGEPVGGSPARVTHVRGCWVIDLVLDKR
jgi:hypothetical protein